VSDVFAVGVKVGGVGGAEPVIFVCVCVCVSESVRKLKGRWGGFIHLCVCVFVCVRVYICVYICMYLSKSV
jgi:hypothetical protein